MTVVLGKYGEQCDRKFWMKIAQFMRKWAKATNIVDAVATFVSRSKRKPVTLKSVQFWSKSRVLTTLKIIPMGMPIVRPILQQWWSENKHKAESINSSTNRPGFASADLPTTGLATAAVFFFNLLNATTVILAPFVDSGWLETELTHNRRRRRRCRRRRALSIGPLCDKSVFSGRVRQWRHRRLGRSWNLTQGPLMNKNC